MKPVVAWVAISSPPLLLRGTGHLQHIDYPSCHDQCKEDPRSAQGQEQIRREDALRGCAVAGSPSSDPIDREGILSPSAIHGFLGFHCPDDPDLVAAHHQAAGGIAHATRAGRAIGDRHVAEPGVLDQLPHGVFVADVDV